MENQNALDQMYGQIPVGLFKHSEENEKPLIVHLSKELYNKNKSLIKSGYFRGIEVLVDGLMPIDTGFIKQTK